MAERSTKQSAEAERIKQLANVAPSIVHDIRNSLGVISSTAQFVLKNLSLPEKDRQSWELVERNIESIKKILSNYLKLAHQAENSREPTSLNEIVERVAAFIDAQSRKQNVKIEKKLDTSLPLIMINLSAVESAVLNICINALEAMDGAGTLRLETRKDQKNQNAVLEIADSGPGISTDVLDKIFSPFFTTKRNGTGMGLYSAKACIEQNSGKIVCESIVGKGTKMVALFPLKSNLLPSKS